jgi:hypothetical protein
MSTATLQPEAKLAPLKTKPTREEIDACASLYLEAKAAEDLAAERTANCKAALIACVQKYGSTPPKSDKSLRLEGAVFQVTVTQGTSTSIDAGAVDLLKEMMVKEGWGKAFKHLFRRETKYSIAPKASEFAANSNMKVRRFFRACISVTTNNPSLKVDRKKGAAA